MLPSFAEGAGFGSVTLFEAEGRARTLYALSQPDGDRVIFGVVDDVLIVANDARARGRSWRAGEPEAVEGANGFRRAWVPTRGARELRSSSSSAPAFGVPDLGGFGTGPPHQASERPERVLVEASTDELRGKLTLERRGLGG